ncbi:GNAT family N-acetyltransferase [Cytobacillus purgationiresistens]|uniref:RimJ/RimL family protein N-acetyltransferase n=1 Tax=Cytobacillus purgationiresistens TaxID=863449 RepID=A0ABU0AKM2_9BACI|nr:GNAT family protein [Cytobacillus purgationiresistens]MDQ0271590.1 RimJ/RimL family protein N-acetyltransferase [Cytobacillus purgationiresistens]
MHLSFYKPHYFAAVNNYHLTEEQLRFTGTPNDAILKSNEGSDRYPILAVEEEKLVTFFVLHRREGVKPYSNNNCAILIRAFSTDSHEQGKGYATKSLKLLPAFIMEHFLDINEIVLAVNVKNTAAQALYEKCGYIDEGVRVMGSKGELIVMSYHFRGEI